jgi:N-acetylglucosamine kinase-like BadF-type ATPase
LPLALAVDGGGTRTRCVIVDQSGTVVGFANGGPTNFDAVGMETARANLKRIIGSARSSLGRTQRIDAAFLGIAGVVSADDRDVVREMIAKAGLSGIPIGIDHDIRIALAGALGGAPGIVLIAGTGSSCYGTDSAGRSWRSGGWGHALDDVGSAYYLGQQALIAIVRAEDGRGEPTALTAPILDALGISDVEQVMHRIYVPHLNRAGVAALAPIVIEQYGRDRAATEIVRAGCNELAVMVAATARKLEFEGRVPVSAVGGLVEAADSFRELLQRATLEAVPAADLRRPLANPLAGAAQLALGQLGVQLSSEALFSIGALADDDSMPSLTTSGTS